MIIEFAPLIFGTAALLAIVLFFSVAESLRPPETPVCLCTAICRSNRAALLRSADWQTVAPARLCARSYIKGNVEGAKAYDDFTSTDLRNDGVLDTKHCLAGISSLARANWS